MPGEPTSIPGTAPAPRPWVYRPAGAECRSPGRGLPAHSPRPVRYGGRRRHRASRAGDGPHRRPWQRRRAAKPSASRCLTQSPQQPQFGSFHIDPRPGGRRPGQQGDVANADSSKRRRDSRDSFIVLPFPGDHWSDGTGLAASAGQLNLQQQLGSAGGATPPLPGDCRQPASVECPALLVSAQHGQLAGRPTVSSGAPWLVTLRPVCRPADDLNCASPASARRPRIAAGRARHAPGPPIGSPRQPGGR